MTKAIRDLPKIIKEEVKKHYKLELFNLNKKNKDKYKNYLEEPVLDLNNILDYLLDEGYEKTIKDFDLSYYNKKTINNLWKQIQLIISTPTKAIRDFWIDYDELLKEVNFNLKNSGRIDILYDNEIIEIKNNNLIKGRAPYNISQLYQCIYYLINCKIKNNQIKNSFIVWLPRFNVYHRFFVKKDLLDKWIKLYKQEIKTEQKIDLDIKLHTCQFLKQPLTLLKQRENSEKLIKKWFPKKEKIQLFYNLLFSITEDIKNKKWIQQINFKNILTELKKPELKKCDNNDCNKKICNYVLFFYDEYNKTTDEIVDKNYYFCSFECKINFISFIFYKLIFMNGDFLEIKNKVFPSCICVGERKKIIIEYDFGFSAPTKNEGPGYFLNIFSIVFLNNEVIKNKKRKIIKVPKMKNWDGNLYLEINEKN